jgi:hypothetical protein
VCVFNRSCVSEEESGEESLPRCTWSRQCVCSTGRVCHKKKVVRRVDSVCVQQVACVRASLYLESTVCVFNRSCVSQEESGEESRQCVCSTGRVCQKKKVVKRAYSCESHESYLYVHN